MPASRQELATAVLNGLIYVIGGFDSAGGRLFAFGGVSNRAFVYDPIANTWTPLAPMNVGRNHCAGGTIGGRFYVAGGRGSAGSDVALEVYDPVANSWTNRAPMPTGRSGIGAGVVNNRLYVFGGEIPVLHGEVESYDPESNTWQQHPAMPTPKHGIWASVISNIIYLPGGATAQGLGATTSHESFTVR
jgi:N-acetylneuraminic acid mutarotase